MSLFLSLFMTGILFVVKIVVNYAPLIPTMKSIEK